MANDVCIWFGCIMLCILQFVIGMVGLALDGNCATTWAQCGLMLAFISIYDLTFGPFCYVLLAEVRLPDCVVPRWPTGP